MKKILLITILLFSAMYLYPQQKANVVDGLMKTALSHMSAGRYGEAIDQLNKYIAAMPQDPVGYYLHAQCLEKRQSYENARLQYRRAIGLQKDNALRAKYEQDLQRMLDYWYALLNQKIDGHRRDIKIDPNKAFNYLEIGKCFMWMEIWDKAELWYDEYLMRDENASPDEIIRYSIILARTGSIVKGEKILKKYTDRYPQDWRLWSRYGYFTFWLGKYPTAKKAFETALAYKPFFKEAEDGLDLVNKQAYMIQDDHRTNEKEYPIDRYFRLLKRKPNDNETRYKLVDELIAVNRIEEAYQQLKIIAITKSEEDRYKEKWKFVTEFRDSVYNLKLNEAKAVLLKNEFDKDALKTVANYYEYLQRYDSATVMLDKYFENYPDDNDQQLRFKYAKIAAWNREFDKALNVTDGLLSKFPNNLDYQLFRAQVSVWNNRDLEIADKYLDNVLKARPNDLPALVSKSSIYLSKRDFDNAQALADKAKNIDPNDDDVVKLQSNIDFQKLRAEEEKNYAILELGRQRVLDGDPAGGIPYYEEFFSKAEPNDLIKKEFGDVLFAAKDYNRSLETYNQVLANGENYDAQLQRAKLYYTMGDSLNAVSEFKQLVKKDSTNFESLLYLGDSYLKIAEADSARDIYNTLLDTWQLDSTQTQMVKLRKGWLPISGIQGIIETFPNFVALAPSISYYADNLSFRLLSTGARLDLGFTNFLSFGVSFIRHQLRANAASLNQDVIEKLPYFYTSDRFTTFKGHVFLRFSDKFNMGVGLGKSNGQGFSSRDEQDAYFIYDDIGVARVTLNYQNSDAALILYSPYLISIRQMARLYKIQGYYRHRDGMKFEGSFHYVGVDDGNEGNNLYFRLGRYFYKDLAVGYEYAYDNYKWKSNYYYSPRNFESHSLWVDNELDKKDSYTVTIGGKIGITPQNSLVILQGYVDGKYKPYRNLEIVSRIGIGSTSRDNSSYRFFSGQLSAYWTIF